MGGTVLQLESEKCIEQGLAKGRMEGRMEGRAEGRADIVKNMIRKAMPDSAIAELSGLPISEISALKAQMQQQSLSG